MSRIAWLVLATYAALLGLVAVSGRRISGHDDARVAGIAREMALRDDYIIPRLNGTAFLEYPSLGYVPMALALRVSGGPSDFLVLAPAALFGVGTVLLTALAATLIGGARVGFLSGFALATLAGFFNLHRRALVDPALVFWTTASVCAFLHGFFARPPRAVWFGASLAAAVAAFLSKGLLGLAIPFAAATAFLGLGAVSGGADGLRTREAREGPRGSALSAWLALVVSVLPPLAWACLAVRTGDGEHFREVLRQSVWRFSSGTADHSGPIHFYLGPVLYLTLPWVLLALPLLAMRWGPRRWRRKVVLGPEFLLPLAWFTVIFLGLSLASAKRNLYLGPIFPSAAILASLAWARLTRDFPRLVRLERALPLLFLGVYAAIQFAVILPSENPDCPAPIFESFEREERGRPAWIAFSNEGFRGASVYWLGRTLPEIRTREEWDRVLSDRGEKILLVIHRRDASPFPEGSPPPGLRVLDRLVLETRFAATICEHSGR